MKSTLKIRTRFYITEDEFLIKDSMRPLKINLIHMKKYAYILILTLFSVGCDDFLEEDTRGILSPDGFYATEAQANAGVFGLYNILKNNNLYGRNLFNYTTWGTDEMTCSRRFGAANPLLDASLSTSDLGWTVATWNSLNSLVVNANSVFSGVNNSSIDPEIKSRILAEAIFLRSVGYYHLTHMFGDVVYHKEDLPIDELAELGETPAEEIVADLVADLEATEDDLPTSYESSEAIRATRWAAKTLRMKLLLWQGAWAEAEAVGKDIIDNSGLTLEPEFATLWDNDVDGFTSETIWQMIYAFDLDTSPLTDFYVPRLRDEPANQSDRQALETALDANGDGFTGFGLLIPSDPFIASLSADDTRTPVNFTQEYEGISLKFPYTPKFQNFDQETSPRFNHGDNSIVFRLADIYLMLAEALNEQNQSAEALTYINVIRARAYEPDRPDLVGLTQDAVRQEISNERRWELAGEGHRRYDLIRWGTYIETVRNYDYGPLFDPSGIQDHQVLFPLDPEQVRLTPGLVQTPGYQ